MRNNASFRLKTIIIIFKNKIVSMKETASDCIGYVKMVDELYLKYNLAKRLEDQGLTKSPQYIEVDQFTYRLEKEAHKLIEKEEHERALAENLRSKSDELF